MPSKLDDVTLRQDETFVWRTNLLVCGRFQMDITLAALSTSSHHITYGDLWVVHRLDRDTSRVIVLARNGESHQELCRHFTRP